MPTLSHLFYKLIIFGSILILAILILGTFVEPYERDLYVQISPESLLEKQEEEK